MLHFGPCPTSSDAAYKLFAEMLLASNILYQEPITRSLQLPHISVTAFSQTGLFLLFQLISNSYPHRNRSDQLQSQARTNVDMLTECRHVHVRLHCFIFTEACSCRLERAYFAGKISKNRLVCKNAVALAYYGSCRLLVMSSCLHQVFAESLISLRNEGRL